MSERNPEKEARRRQYGQVDKMTSVVIGLGLSFAIYNSRVLEKIGIVEERLSVSTDDTVATTTTLSPEERELLYGTQKLFICQIPDVNGVMRTVEVNIGGPETPIMIARLLSDDDAEAYSLLSAGVDNYNELEPQTPILVDFQTEQGVRAIDGSVLSTTQLWGIKDMTVSAFQENTP
jgi:hypothetical protein